MPDLGEIEPTNYIEISTETIGTVSVGTGRTNSNPVVFEKWLINTSSTPIQRIRFIDGSVQGILKLDGGTGSIRYGVFESTDGGATFFSIFRIDTGSSSEVALDGGADDFAFNVNMTHLGLMALNSNPTGFGTVRNSKITVVMDLPPGYSITRIE